MKELFYSNGIDIFGPVSIEEFSENKYYKSTLIWYDGLSGWVPIGECIELKHLIGTMTAPSLETGRPMTQNDLTPPLTKTGRVNHFVKYRKLVVGSAIALLLLAIAQLILYAFDKADTGNPQTSNFQKLTGSFLLQNDTGTKNELVRVAVMETEKKTYRLNWGKFIMAMPNDFKKGIIGIEDLKISLMNKSPYLLDSVKVKVAYLKANGDIYLTEILEFENVDPKSSKSLFAPDSNRGVKVSCTIISLHSRAMNLCFKRKNGELVSNGADDAYRCK